MRKYLLLTKIAVAAISLWGGALYSMAQGYQATIPFTETFDDETHYTLGGDLPDGWLGCSGNEGEKGFVKTEFYDNGLKPYSGDYYVSSEANTINHRNDFLYTPLMAMQGGKEYTVSFYMYATSYNTGRQPSFEITAGTAQTADAQTTIISETQYITFTDWTLVEATFTPETDGEYSIALHATAPITGSGIILVDDFSITAEETPEPPVVEWTASIPYAENFDDETHYNGVDFLPNGWFSSGENPFLTANSPNLPAISGEYYMVTTSSSINNRRDIAYTPLLEMEAGQEYTVSFYLCMPGKTSEPSFKFTVGQDQAYDMQETVLLEYTGTINEWTRYECKFTPETTGEYCFAFWAQSKETGDGLICVDNFRLSKTDEIFAPETDFKFGNALYSQFTGGPKLFQGQTIQMINATDDADSFLWTVTGGDATISDATAVNPTITFKEAASYTVTLEAKNEGGTKEVSRKFNPEFAVPGETDCVQTTNEYTDKIYQQDNAPAFREDGTVEDVYTYETFMDYVVGVNPYYRAFAERFDVPQNCGMELTSINFFTHNYYLFDQTLGVGNFDKEKQLTVVIYPEKDGKPDIANPVYSKTDLISNMIKDDFHSVRQSIKFDDASEPVVVNGPFYIALEFDSLTIVPYDPGYLSRSYFGADTRIHDNGQTTLWVKPEKAIPGSDFEKNGNLKEYCRADEFSKELTGYSFGVMPWVVYGEMSTDGINGTENDNQNVKVYATIDGDNFKVSGLKPGSNVRVYSSNGSAVFEKKAGDSEMIIPAGAWTKGIYVISADDQSIKVTK